jgi:hypothetical protein
MTLFFALSELGLGWTDIAEMHRSFVDAIHRANQDLLDSWWRL